MIVLSVRVVVAFGLDGVVLAVGDDGVGLRIASQPSLPKNLMDGARCSDDIAVAGAFSALIGSGLSDCGGSGLSDCGGSGLSDGGGGAGELLVLGADVASTVAVASVSSSYKFAPTSTVSSLSNTIQ